jgi:hypothetical protein
MEHVQSQQSLSHYARAYQQLYKRTPKDLRMLADGWVIVNGARMRVAELDYLTQQLEFEYNRQVVERRSVVRRLIGWFGRR